MLVTERLLATIRAAVPAVVDVSIGTVGNSATVLVSPTNQQTAAQATINAFDWSAGAQAAWEDQQNPDKANLRDAADAAITTNDTFLAIASPSNAQTLTQVKALTQQNTKIIKYLKKQL